MFHLKNGYSVPLVLIAVLLIISVPVYYWATNNNLNTNFSNTNNVRGVSTSPVDSYNPGFKVSIISDSETWDMVEYLCKDKDECISNLNSGRRLGTISGGKTDLHEVMVEYTKEWDDYTYLKLFVKSGWNAPKADFKIIQRGQVPGSELIYLPDSGSQYEVVLLPIKPLKNSFYNSVTFSDR